MTIFPIAAFRDNYIWAWIDPNSKMAWVVDPGDAEPVITILKQQQVGLAGILLTHHHHDHSGGIAKLIHLWSKIKVYGSSNSPVAAITHRLQEGDSIHCGPMSLKVLTIPGHTLDHMAFWNEQVLFCGDTLFSAGCGRVFEGTPSQMYQSLQKLSHLSPELRIYCGHEYTEANLQFARIVEPGNVAIRDKLAEVQKLRKQGQPTLPSLLKEENKINPFLRCCESDVIASAEKQANRSLKSPVEVFSVLREWKNSLS